MEEISFKGKVHKKLTSFFPPEHFYVGTSFIPLFYLKIIELREEEAVRCLLQCNTTKPHKTSKILVRCLPLLFFP